MRRGTLVLATLAAILFSFASCSGSEEGAEARDAVDVAEGTDAAADPGAELPAADATTDTTGLSEVLVGSFVVSLIEAVPASSTTAASDAYSQVVGQVFDGPTPSLVAWNAKRSGGGCELLEKHVPFCSEGCGAAACVADETCMEYPDVVDVGIVVVQGVHTAEGASEVTMKPAGGAYQTVGALPFPPFDEGADVVLQAAGKDIGPFTIPSRGIAPLAMPDDAIVLARDTVLDVSWTPPGVPGISVIHVKLDISHHGGAKAMLVCDVADTGSLTIPADLVTGLLDMGVAGFPTIELTRRAVGAVNAGAGRVELEVQSDLSRAVGVPGVVSCNEDADCPAEKPTCGTDLNCK